MNNTVYIDPQDILKEQHKYFSDIFSSHNSEAPLLDENTKNFFPENRPHLTTEERHICEGLITEEELTLAINSFKTGKSPGLDGIPIEFYKAFYPKIKIHMLDCFSYAYSEGKLSGTQQEGLISLLLKQESNGQYKDPTTLKNWRPLTLQCYDVKILAKCIANRIKKVLSKLIHPNQSGFMKGRNINENIRQILEIIEFYENVQKPGIIVITDLEKAFDKL